MLAFLAPPSQDGTGGGGGGSKVKRTQLSERSWVERGRVPIELARHGAEFKALWELRPEHKGTVVLYGKRQEIPRFQMAYGVPYSFSGQTLGGGPVPPLLQPYLDWANNTSGYGSGRFNGILLNWYEDGTHYIGKHSDDERQLVPGEPILSISLGQARTFKITRRHNCTAPVHVPSLELTLPHGSLVVMGGDMQKEFVHEVKKEDSKKGRAMGRRINITMRAFRTGPAGAPLAALPAETSGGSRGSSPPAEASGGSRGSSPPPAKRQRT